MTLRIRRTLAQLAIGVLAATAGITATASPAQAFGGEVLGCRVSPGPATAFTNPCLNKKGAATYNAGFWLQNLSGPGYTFSWSWTGGPVLFIVAGCTSTSDGCGLAVANSDTIVRATVTYSQGGQTGSQTATAVIRQFCGSVPC
ncbi:hypothetical protein Rhe02_73880 [Rhizocola hellebori]|uniref:Secreted protein n=1 Tax=Rhizocola hellebori TaxID=1392758 RepID=A0A8J3QHD2_9ACTN|nr:hypothetical protein [Rhizocola hellebori]GIH09321.1 hypothetical protein Rhe02_73880 [Rhizocola hellebori]